MKAKKRVKNGIYHIQHGNNFLNRLKTCDWAFSRRCNKISEKLTLLVSMAWTYWNFSIWKSSWTNACFCVKKSYKVNVSPLKSAKKNGFIIEPLIVTFVNLSINIVHFLLHSIESISTVLVEKKNYSIKTIISTNMAWFNNYNRASPKSKLLIFPPAKTYSIINILNIPFF